jgi:DNA polymerase-1
LVLEAPRAERDEVRDLVKKEMESVYPLNVPLRVDTGTGVNWRDAK